MRPPLRRRTVFFFKPTVQDGQQFPLECLSLDMIVAAIKRRSNSLHCGQKNGYGLAVTLTVVKSGEDNSVLVGIA